MRLGVVVKGYPRLSETFIAQEILELQRAGFDLEILSLRHPTDTKIHPVHREITARQSYLPEYLYQEPWRVIKGWWFARRLPGYRKARRIFLRDWWRDPTPNRGRRWGQALVLARDLNQSGIGFLYGHFIHTPTSVTRYAAIMRAIPFAISAHAKDIWTTPHWELSEKLGDCQWCVTCTAGGRDALAALAPPGRVHLVYHGIDLSRFPVPPPRALARPGTLRMLTVGRAVEKKGLDTLVAALGLLPRELDWQWTHIGGGPLRDRLREQARGLGVLERCTFQGARSQEEVIAAYREHDLFVLPCRIGGDGDRDGLPNVLVEAQSQGLAVLTTPVSGIPELVEDGRNGRFVPPDDPASLAEAMIDLAARPDLCMAMGAQGEAIVRSRFDHSATIGQLRDLLGGSMAAAEKLP